MGNSHAYAVAAAVVPAAFAMAEHLGGVSGRDLLTAVATGLEIEIRMIDGAPHAIDTPFGSTYMFGNLGATVAAAKLLGLDVDATHAAYGMAYAQAAGNYQAQSEGHQALSIRLQMGFCVRTGIHSALLSRHRMGGPRQFLTGRAGLYPAFFGECDREAVLSGLGHEFKADRLGFKAYPCCALNHQALDAMRQLRDRCDVADIESVLVHGAPYMWKTTRPIEAKQRPTSPVELPWSLPWTAACVLTAGQLSLGDMQVEALQDPARSELATRIWAELDAPEDGVYAVATRTDGRTVESSRIAAPSGHPAHPLALEDVVARWEDVVRFGPPRLRQEDLDAARDAVLALEELVDATSVIRLLA
jgi:2-methylcitrate dehydratase PrpD